MCTVVVSIGRNSAWPLLLAANRDERLDRPARPPACHWPDHPDVIGGFDVLAGGTWLALNRSGVVAAVLNRLGSLGPQPGKRSRGELPLLALHHHSAAAAIAALEPLDAADWRSFNLIVADRKNTYYLRGTGHGRIYVRVLAPGVHLVTARDPDDMSSPRVARNLPRFKAAPTPNPPDWSTWPTLLADSTPPMDASINITPFSGFGTVSSALVGLGEAGRTMFMSTDAPPHAGPFSEVGMAWA